MEAYIWQNKSWPNFTWNTDEIHTVSEATERKQAELEGAMAALGFSVRQESNISAISSEIEKSAQIEGEHIPQEDIRSSVARHLGAENILTAEAVHRLNIGKIPERTDYIVKIVLDAIKNSTAPLTKERLCLWQSRLFPSGISGGYKITTGRYRLDEYGPMRIISGNMGKETVHYIAPPAVTLNKEMHRFLNWFNKPASVAGGYAVKSAVAHLYFVSIHPFDDGNGRLARILADMILSQRGDDCLFSMSAQLQKNRAAYYAELEKTQHGDLDITDWITWYLTCMTAAADEAMKEIQKTGDRIVFWKAVNEKISLNERQRTMLDKLLANWQGKLTTSKWASICGCSQDTASRDINKLIEAGIMRKEAAGGRSTSYAIIEKEK
ncbi:MAG: Fic family protein [Spirochaetia bacterium]|jgi:Fic family protein|nr:Fic family protein [Spirochaetia bacterium]